MGPAITLTTDFGTQDGYVGAMKGVIHMYAPRAVVVDITHDIPPQNIICAAWALANCWRCYPAGTVHAAVVDPGVGSARKGMIMQADEQFFVAPDNGLLSLVMQQAERSRYWAIKEDVHVPERKSNTFHGRDVFAYTAALLAGSGSPPEGMCLPVEHPVMLPYPEPCCSPECVAGEIVHIDRFGNMITNIHRDQMAALHGLSLELSLEQQCVSELVATYSAGSPGELVGLLGSHEYLEIAVPGGSAAAHSGLQTGARVQLSVKKQEQ